MEFVHATYAASGPWLLVQFAKVIKECPLLIGIGQNSYSDRFVNDICSYIAWISCNEIEARGHAAARGEHDRLANFERVEYGGDVGALLAEIQGLVRSARAF